jgi:hypothetical protein
MWTRKRDGQILDVVSGVTWLHRNNIGERAAQRRGGFTFNIPAELPDTPFTIRDTRTGYIVYDNQANVSSYIRECRMPDVPDLGDA